VAAAAAEIATRAIGGHHDAQAAVAQQQQHRVAIVLFHAAVQRHCSKARPRERAGDLVARLAVITEHDRGLGPMMAKDPDQRRHTLGARDFVQHLRDPRSDVLRGNDHVERRALI
jgi:hypothetical protein